MKKYEYENATVYITIPTEKHLANIKKATEVFLKKAVKEGVFDDDHKRKGNRRVSVGDSNARTRNRKVKKADSQNQAIHRSI